MPSTQAAELWMRRRAKRILGRLPPVRRYIMERQALSVAWAESGVERDRLRDELQQLRAAATAEREFLLAQLKQLEEVIAEQNATINNATALSTMIINAIMPDANDQQKKILELRAVIADRNETSDAVIAERPPSTKPVYLLDASVPEQNSAIESLQRTPAERLIELIASGADLGDRKVEALTGAVETFVLNPDADKIGIHREIGKALFARSSELYAGTGIPPYLVRYTYPPVISIALSSHCNAACFFCRDSDYKGSSVNFDNLFKLESAVRNARTIDLTGWGEPFFYPRFEEVVDYIGSINDTKQLIQVTSNGSFLSEKWGRMLSGKLNRLIVSINAATPDTYADQMRYKNKSFTFDGTIQNIREFQAQLTDEDRKRIFLHMVANTGNFKEITTLVRLAGDLHIPTVNVGNYICANEEHLDKTLWNVKEEYNAEIACARELGLQLGVTVYGRKFFASDEQEIKGAEKCMAPFEQFFIEMEGTTAPCCFMGTERMGNVYQDGFEAVWFSDTMNRLRQHRFLPPCQVCTVFTPFDSKTAHMSAFLTTNAEDVVLGGGPELGSRGKRGARPKSEKRAK